MKFVHRSPSAVSVTHGGECYPVIDGVIDCPEELGRAHRWKALEEPKPEDQKPAEQKPAEKKLLAGTVGEIEYAVQAIEDLEVLKQLQADETAGKARKGVLEALAARLEQLESGDAQ
jgi:hypothetical protein